MDHVDGFQQLVEGGQGGAASVYDQREATGLHVLPAVKQKQQEINIGDGNKPGWSSFFLLWNDA